MTCNSIVKEPHDSTHLYLVAHLRKFWQCLLQKVSVDKFCQACGGSTVGDTAQSTDEKSFLQASSLSRVKGPICVKHSVTEPRNLNTALVKPTAKTLTAGVVRWAHYVHFLTMMRAQLRSCKTGQTVVGRMHAVPKCMTVCQQPYSLPLPTIFPSPQPCPLRFQSLLAADIWSQKCCGVEVTYTETRFDTTDFTVLKEKPGRWFVYRGP
jgi:hypothetical protein